MDYIMECEATFMYSGNNIETVEKTRCKLFLRNEKKSKNVVKIEENENVQT